MKYLITLFILSFFACNTKNKKEKYTDQTLCDLITQITESDQRYRGMQILRSPIFGILDSIKNARNISDYEYQQFSREQRLELGRLANRIAEKENIPKDIKKKRDSLIKLQKKIDRNNTELIISILKNLDSAPENISCETNLLSIPILHAPEEYWEELKPLVKKAYKEERITEVSYNLALWHFGGRNQEGTKSFILNNTNNKESKIEVHF